MRKGIALKKILLFQSLLALFLTTNGIAFAKKADPTPSETPSFTVSPSPTPAPQWVPPPSTETYFDNQTNRLVEKISTKVSVNSFYQTDATGNFMEIMVDLDLKRKFDAYPIGAEADIRFGKNFDNSYDADYIQMRLAKFSLSEPFLTFTAGRFDFGQDLSPTNFFGNFLTMGLRRLDGLGLTIPIRFKVGLQTLSEVETPPAALSVFFIPSLLSSTTSTYDSTQSLLIEQLRISSKIENIPFSLYLNLAESSSLYFVDSTMNDNSSFSAALSFSPDRIIDVYGELGIQNTSLMNETTGLAVGVKAKEIYTFGPLSFDVANIEAGIPLSSSLDNPFTGGNDFLPYLATTPQLTIFGNIRARLDDVYVNFAMTNSLGDYTFGRINSNNSAIPPGTVLGETFETPLLGLPLLARSYSQYCYIVDLGVEF